MEQSSVITEIIRLIPGKKGQIRDDLAEKLSTAFTLVLFGGLWTCAESKGGFGDTGEGSPSHGSFIWHCESTSACVRQPL